VLACTLSQATHLRILSPEWSWLNGAMNQNTYYLTTDAGRHGGLGKTVSEEEILRLREFDPPAVSRRSGSAESIFGDCLGLAYVIIAMRLLVDGLLSHSSSLGLQGEQIRCEARTAG
jgi:hypothetical protein